MCTLMLPAGKVVHRTEPRIELNATRYNYTPAFQTPADNETLEEGMPNQELSMKEILNPGEVFPSLSLKIAGGDTVNLPEDLDSNLTIVLFYRGHW